MRSRDRVQGQLPSTMKTSLQKTLRCTSLTDEQARLAYIEVKGKKRTSQMTGSSANLENVETVMQILPSLIDLYGDETNKNLLIITPYRRQVSPKDQALVQELTCPLVSPIQTTTGLAGPCRLILGSSITPCAHCQLLSRKGKLPCDPRPCRLICEIGKEHAYVAYTGSVMPQVLILFSGFMADEARFNVAITRARQALWLVGGPLKGHGLHYTEVAVLAYKYVLERHGKCHAWKAPDIAFESIPSDLRERRETPQQRL